MEAGPEYRTLTARTAAVRADYYRAEISADGLLAIGMGEGVRLWDLGSGRELAFLPIRLTRSVGFISVDGRRSLLTCSRRGSNAWPIADHGGTPRRLPLESPHSIRLPMDPTIMSVGPDRPTAIISGEDAGTAVILDLDTESVRCTLSPHPAVSAAILSPDGRWAATSSWHSQSVVKVWDARTGAAPGPRNSRPAPRTRRVLLARGRTMVTSLVGAYRFYDVPSRGVSRRRCVARSRHFRGGSPSRPTAISSRLRDLARRRPDRNRAATGAAGAPLEDPDSGRAPVARLHGRARLTGLSLPFHTCDPRVGHAGDRSPTRESRPERRTPGVAGRRGLRPRKRFGD